MVNTQGSMRTPQKQTSVIEYQYLHLHHLCDLFNMPFFAQWNKLSGPTPPLSEIKLRNEKQFPLGGHFTDPNNSNDSNLNQCKKVKYSALLVSIFTIVSTIWLPLDLMMLNPKIKIAKASLFERPLELNFRPIVKIEHSDQSFYIQHAYHQFEFMTIRGLNLTRHVTCLSRTRRLIRPLQ